MGADQGKAMIASCSREATGRPSTSISTSTIARSPLRRWNRSTTTAWTSATAAAGANPWCRTTERRWIHGPRTRSAPTTWFASAGHTAGWTNPRGGRRRGRRRPARRSRRPSDRPTAPAAMSTGSIANGRSRSAAGTRAQRRPRHVLVATTGGHDDGVVIDDGVHVTSSGRRPARRNAPRHHRWRPSRGPRRRRAGASGRRTSSHRRRAPPGNPAARAPASVWIRLSACSGRLRARTVHVSSTQGMLAHPRRDRLVTTFSGPRGTA